MKKLVSLIKASMTSGMNVFKINSKASSKRKVLPLFIAFWLMFTIWSNANIILEKLDRVGLEYIALSIFVVGISMFTLIEGIYKSGTLIFNCKDDQLLLSLPIKKSTVLFVRIFKFYVFELIFNSLFLVPVIIAYLRWAKTDVFFFLTSFIMILFLPIIPIVVSCIIGAITTGLSSRFKYKNFFQIILTMLIFIGVMYVSMNMDKFLIDLVQNAKGLNDIISKIYYPAGVYADLVVKFDITKLLVFMLINIALLVVGIFVLSKVYFKINTRMKSVVTSRKVKSSKCIEVKVKSQTWALIKKEFSTFFNTPVFIINAGFGLVLYLILAISVFVKFNLIVDTIKSTDIISIDLFLKNLSTYNFLIIILVLLTTSITSSMISLEGRNFNILKSFPVKTEEILKSKLYASLIITIPLVIIGDFLIFIRLQFGILEFLLILLETVIFSILSGLIGLIINLRYPKLDFENSAEIVKQSVSSFVSVAIGLLGVFISFFIISSLIEKGTAPLMIMGVGIGIALILDLVLYLYLMKKGVEQFNKLNV